VEASGIHENWPRGHLSGGHNSLCAAGEKQPLRISCDTTITLRHGAHFLLRWNRACVALFLGQGQTTVMLVIGITGGALFSGGLRLIQRRRP